MGQKSRREQEYEKGKKKNYVIISLTFNITKLQQAIPSQTFETE